MEGVEAFVTFAKFMIIWTVMKKHMLIPERVASIDELIQNIETVESYINEDASQESFDEMSEYIKRGHNFVAYKVDEKWHFAPSRFVGYKNNNLEKHREFRINRLISGTETDGRLSSKQVLGMEKIENKELDSHYKTFCDWLEVTPENRIRKFWVLDGDIASEFTDATPFFEGSVRVREHKQRERNRKVVEQAKRLFKQKNGRLYCQICGLDFEQVYGEIGKGFIEAHHNVPLAAEDKEREIRVCDFTLVCSNCHSMLHRVFGGESPTIEDLKKRMKN